VSASGLRDIQQDDLRIGESRSGIRARRIHSLLLMTDVTAGTLREDVLNEKVMSAIVEIKVGVERTEEIIELSA